MAGLFIQLGPDDYVIVGRSMGVYFETATDPTQSVGLAVVEEGEYVDGRWVPGRRLNGDETLEWRALWFPGDRYTILLTEHAKYDPQIVDKIWKHLNANKTIVITTGLLKALEGKGIEKIVEVEYTGRNVIANKFTFRWDYDEEPANYYYSQSDIVLPQLAYGLVDSEEIIQAIYKDDSCYPVLLRARGLDKGRLYILTIPENQSDLYQLPPEVLSQIRRHLMREIPLYLDSPSRICLFTYDNYTFVTRSYQPSPVRYKIVVWQASAKLFDLRTGAQLHVYVDGNTTVFEVLQMPRTYAAYRFE